MRAGLLAVGLAAVLGMAALAEAPESSIRPLPRPLPLPVAQSVAQSAMPDPAVSAAVTSALAVMVSPRPLPKPPVTIVSAAPAELITAPAHPVVPRVSTAAVAPADPIAAFFQGLAAPKPAAVDLPDVPVETSALAVPSSPRPETKPNGFAQLVAAITAPRATSRKGSVCGVPEIKGEAIRAISGSGACGIAKPVRITAVSGVAVTGGPTIDCTTAKALNDWVRSGVIPAVGRKGGGVAQINVVASYSCRSRNNVRGAKLSEHSFGHAVDVGGITLKDGSRLTVLEHWRNGRYGKVFKAMHSAACGPFGTVLGPNADRYHRDHFHFDTARYRSGSYCR